MMKGAQRKYFYRILGFGGRRTMCPDCARDVPSNVSSCLNLRISVA